MDEINVEGIEEYRESEVRIVGNKVELTREDYDKLNEDLEIAQLQLQEANDTLNGGITNRNMAHLRNTYCINSSDSLDDTHPMYVYFRVLDETIKIVSVKVSYWIHKYRAYSTAASSGGAVSSAAGGGQTSSSVGTPSGGGSTSGAGGGISQSSGSSATLSASYADVINEYFHQPVATGSWGILSWGSVISLSAHTHLISVANHSHSTPAHVHPAHSHTVADHTHTGGAHTHGVTYGIYEEDNTPIIKFSVSQDGVTYGDAYGNQAINQELINITDSITKTGSKILKFESTTRARLTVQVEIKVDISVR